MPVVSEVRCALERFPLEVWEKILDEVEDSQDIFNTLKAFPVLDLSSEFQKKKTRWLFDMVFPILLENADINPDLEDEPGRDLLKCRLVCKRWAAGVSNYLNNRPMFNIPDSDCLISASSQQPFSERIWTFSDMPLSSYLSINEILCFTIDFEQGPDNVTQRIAELNRLFPSESGRNPFVGGILRIIKDFSHYPDYYVEELCEVFEKEIWAALLKLTKQWGKHVSILMVSLDEEGLDKEWDRRLLDRLRVIAWTNLLKLLRHLPNLKYFELEGHISCHYYLRKLDRLVFPRLPNLETLIVDKARMNYPLLEKLIKEQAGTLRRLRMSHLQWDNELSPFLSQLTDLELTWIVSESAMKKVGDNDAVPLPNLLANLKRSQITRLVLGFFGRAYLENLGIRRDVFTWLRNFPQLQSLELAVDIWPELYEDVSLNPAGGDSFPGLKFLRIMDGNGLNYEFLRSFPSLQCLDVTVCLMPDVVDQSGPDSVIKLKEQLQTGQVYQSNVWELLPKLKEVVARYEVKRYAFEVLRFHRDQYEYLKKEGRLPPVGEIFPYNSSVRSYLDFVAFKEASSAADEENKGESVANSEDDGGNAEDISENDQENPDEDGNEAEGQKSKEFLREEVEVEDMNEDAGDGTGDHGDPDE